VPEQALHPRLVVELGGVLDPELEPVGRQFGDLESEVEAGGADGQRHELDAEVAQRDRLRRGLLQGERDLEQRLRLASRSGRIASTSMPNGRS
jgi:hypothetical protein